METFGAHKYTIESPSPTYDRFSRVMAWLPASLALLGHFWSIINSDFAAVHVVTIVLLIINVLALVFLPTYIVGEIYAKGASIRIGWAFTQLDFKDIAKIDVRERKVIIRRKYGFNLRLYSRNILEFDEFSTRLQDIFKAYTQRSM
ncbi:MAG: hypothetical protein FWB98_09185 [Defluviitaleaceae bacterium]|nr:hypothetical protein [Defluviitaleaceae bacterium]